MLLVRDEGLDEEVRELARHALDLHVLGVYTS